MAGLVRRRTDAATDGAVASRRRAAPDDRSVRAALLVVGVAASTLIFALSRWAGPGVTPDSVAYLAAAESLAGGEGFRGADGGAYAAYPPLLPFVLALLSAGPADAETAARLLNAVCFGATAFLAGWAVWQSSGSPMGALVTAIAVTFLRPGVDAALHVWSEPVFTTLAMLALALALRRVARPGDERALWLACAAAGLAALTRYIGVLVVLAVAVTPLLDRTPHRRAALRGLGAGGVALAPLALWCLYNLARTGTFAGERYPSGDTLRDVVHATAMALARPLAPPVLSGSVAALALVALAAALVGAALWRAFVAGDPRVERAARRLAPLALFTALYLAYLVAASARTALDPIDDRLIAPVLPPLIVVLVGLATAAVRGGIARTALVAALLLWLIAPAAATARYLERVGSDGIGGYGAARWRDSALLAALRDVPDDAILYSNDPFAVRYWTGRAARLSPRRHPYRSPGTPVDDLPALREALASGREVRLVWFEGVPRDFLAGLAELAPAIGLQPMFEATGGTVYRITRVE
jgi:hypothetical protein